MVLKSSFPFLVNEHSKDMKASFIHSYKQIIYAFLLYLPTLIFSSEMYYMFLPFAILIFEFTTLKKQSFEFLKNPFRKHFLNVVWLPFFFVFFALINKWINGNEILCNKDYYASFYLFPLLILSASFTANSKFYKTLIFIICIEVLVSFIEYLFNVRTFFLDKTHGNIILTKDLLYDSRVFGLSANSSIIAMKLFCGLLLVELAMMKSWYKWFARIVLIVGLILTFNRAVLVAIFVFWTLYAIYFAIKNRKQSVIVIKRIFSPFIFFFLLFYCFSNHSFLYQFSRGESVDEKLKYEYQSKEIVLLKDLTQDCASRHAIEMKEGNDLKTTGFFSHLFLKTISGINTSGRAVIWLNYFSFIDQHILFGNGSDKLMLKTVNQDEKKIDLIHAHNSFIELLATNGALLSGFFLVILAVMWKKRNFILLITIVLYSLFQYGIFWGFSFLDVIFMGFLLSNKNLLFHEDK